MTVMYACGEYLKKKKSYNAFGIKSLKTGIHSLSQGRAAASLSFTHSCSGVYRAPLFGSDRAGRWEYGGEQE